MVETQGKLIELGAGSRCPVRISRADGEFSARFLGAVTSRPKQRTASIVFAGLAVALFLIFEFGNKPSSLWFFLTLDALATVWAASVAWGKSVVLVARGTPDGLQLEEIRRGKRGTRTFPHGTFSAPELVESKTTGGFALRMRCADEVVELATSLDRKCAEETRNALLTWARTPSARH